MSEVLGKCPSCGNDVVGGKYGPYCVAKCGFTASKAFGHDLTEAEVEDLLAGKEVFLRDCISKKDGDEHKYDMYVKADGVEDYPYTKKDGTEATGKRFKYVTRFPEKDEVPAPKVGKCPNCGKDVLYGKYGGYCVGKCGFNLGKVFGKMLSEEEVKAVMTGEETLLKGCIHKNDEGEEKKYDMYVKAVDIEEFPYQKKDGTEATGIRYKYETRFPENVKKGSSGENDDTPAGSEELKIPADISDDAGLDLPEGYEDLPFA